MFLTSDERITKKKYLKKQLIGTKPIRAGFCELPPKRSHFGFYIKELRYVPKKIISLASRQIFIASFSFNLFSKNLKV